MDQSFPAGIAVCSAAPAPRDAATSTSPRRCLEPGSAPAAGGAAIEAWSARIDLPSPLASHLAIHLSDDEQARAERFVSGRDRNRFVAGRALLRLLLARHLGAGPRDLRFCYGPHGKPGLAAAGTDLRFNLAHSDAVAVCVVTRGACDIGVDVERVRPIRDFASLARKTLSPREAACLLSLPEPARLPAFYEAWTRKEALLKALGCGLDRPLDSVEVSFGRGAPPRLLAGLADRAEATRFSLHALEPDVGYVGAVAVTDCALPVRQLRWRWT